MTINEFLLFHSDRKKQLHNKTAAVTSKLQTPFTAVACKTPTGLRVTVTQTKSPETAKKEERAQKSFSSSVRAFCLISHMLNSACYADDNTDYCLLCSEQPQECLGIIQVIAIMSSEQLEVICYVTMKE